MNLGIYKPQFSRGGQRTNLCLSLLLPLFWTGFLFLFFMLYCYAHQARCCQLPSWFCFSSPYKSIGITDVHTVPGFVWLWGFEFRSSPLWIHVFTSALPTTSPAVILILLAVTISGVSTSLICLRDFHEHWLSACSPNWLYISREWPCLGNKP